MKISIELLNVAGIIPRLKLGIKKAKGGMTSTGVHRVKLISDKIIKAKDFTAVVALCIASKNSGFGPSLSMTLVIPFNSDIFCREFFENAINISSSIFVLLIFIKLLCSNS